MIRTPPRTFPQRLRSLALFIALTWVLAGTFVVSELLYVGLHDVLLPMFAALDKPLVMRATEQSTSCIVRPEEVVADTAVGAGADFKSRAWMLGVHQGRDGQSRQMRMMNADVNGDARGFVEQLARNLSVPAPALFAPKQLANANTEFIDVVEDDAGGTGHALAVRYSPDACRAYKLGAFWGFAALPRVSLPGERSIYASELQYYGRQLGLSSTLIDEMTRQTPAGASQKDLAAGTVAITERVTTELTSPPVS